MMSLRCLIFFFLCLFSSSIYGEYVNSSKLVRPFDCGHPLHRHYTNTAPSPQQYWSKRYLKCPENIYDREDNRSFHPSQLFRHRHSGYRSCCDYIDDTSGNTSSLFGSAVFGNCNHSGEVPIVDSPAWRRSVAFYVILALSYLILIAIILFLAFRNKLQSSYLISILKRRTRQEQNVMSLVKKYESPGLKKYKYSEIKRMTNSFKDKLGQGGYGGVFKGNLTDGQLVAVKLLNDSEGRGEDFINEIDTIGKTNHVNIVTLIGYCCQGSKRALVYEFMTNGSLEKFIYKDKPRTTFLLEWGILYKIVLGVARGLEYLHNGCTTRILHFDIKPNNILLDQDFCPKISDFGLAKLCLTRQSVQSIFGFRGTFGYVAPEVYCRNIYPGVSCKSDVYSYGMMLLEIVRGRHGISPREEDNSEVHFPRLIYKHLERQEVKGLQRLLEEVINEEVSRKMTLVGLWCIQMDPTIRPSMSRVAEMLEGSVDSLSIPPNPFVDSSCVIIE